MLLLVDVLLEQAAALPDGFFLAAFGAALCNREFSPGESLAGVTAPGRICLVPTLLAGSCVAAYEVPPSATNKATMARWWRLR